MPSRPVELHRWLARAILAIVAGLIPWTAYLAWSLPRHFQAHNWRLAWVGFDAALIAVLAYTAWAAWARRQILAPTAIAAATMLICDAWFDVNTSFGTRGEALTIVTALGGNLPLALVLIWLARRIMLRSAAVLAEARGTGDRPRHAFEVTMAAPPPGTARRQPKPIWLRCRLRARRGSAPVTSWRWLFVPSRWPHRRRSYLSLGVARWHEATSNSATLVRRGRRRATMRTHDVDVVVVGTSGGRYPGAFFPDKAGRRMMMVDPIGNLVGACLAEGYVPSKAVREASLMRA